MILGRWHRADAEEGLDPETVERVFGLAGPEVLGRELEPRRSSAEQPVEKPATLMDDSKDE